MTDIQRVCLLQDTHSGVEHVWNVMAYAQKPDFVFQRNGRVHLNRRGESVQSTTGSRGVRISGSNGSNAGYTVFCGAVQDYWPPTPLACFPLHFPYRASPCAIRFQPSSTHVLHALTNSECSQPTKPTEFYVLLTVYPGTQLWLNDQLHAQLRHIKPTHRTVIKQNTIPDAV